MRGMKSGWILFAVLAALPARDALAQARITQTFTLQPGWNAIYVEVDPDVPDIEGVFADVPVASVWRWFPDEPGIDFIQDPAEGLDQIDGWFGYFPAPREEAVLSTLFTVTANEAYLVDVDSSGPVTLRITGKPVIKPRRWVTDGFTLTGFPVSESNPPTFGEFFAYSPAHMGQPVYRLDPDGVWETVSPGTAIEPGEAYWKFTAGPSSYQGPMEVSVESAVELDFGSSVTDARFSLINNSDLPTDFVIRRISSERVPLVFELLDPETQEVGFPQLPEQYAVTVPADGDTLFNIAIRRRDFTAVRLEEILEIDNGMGTRQRIFVAGQTVQPVIPVAAAAAAKGAPMSAAELAAARAKAGTDEFAGLWVGTVLVNQVSESQLAGTTPLPTNQPFPMRIMLHVDAFGQVRLLKEVIKMWEEGSYAPSASNPGLLEVDTPGRFVLVTRDELIPNFSGAALREGREVGIRYSTVTFDFPGDLLELEGVMGPDQQLTGQIEIPSEFPTNPFYHRYHPDHDNLDPQFLNPVAEAQALTRQFTITFAAEDPSGANDPRYLSEIIAGTFAETILGLHRNPIYVAGTFELERISAVPVLNQ